MQSDQPERSTSTALDIVGLWLCTECGDIHGAPPCPRDGLWFPEDPARVDTGVRLCACCARVAVPSGSPFASFFCAICGPPIVEINRSLGRLAVPICLDLEANLAQLPSSATQRETVSAAPPRKSFFDSQLELLERSCSYRADFLLDRLRLPAEPIPLETYLREVVQLRHESFHAEAARKRLVNRFHEYVIELPAESPELMARVRRKARGFAAGFASNAAKQLRARGPSFLREVVWEWVRREAADVQRLPRCLPALEPLAQERLVCTSRAVVHEAVKDFERVFGPVQRPLAPSVPPHVAAMVLAHPGEEWPDYLPRRCPSGARLVVGLEGAPAQPDMPLNVYHLSMDRRHQWWVLWGEVGDDEGLVTQAPVAWSTRSGLTARDAGFLLLEASLRKDRETYGADRKRPEYGMPGLLDEDLTDVLLDLVWEVH